MAKERKRKISKNRMYNSGDMQKAVEEAKKGKSMRSVSISYNVPYATLQSRVRGTYSLDVKPGPNSILTNEEENQLVTWIFDLSKCGFPIMKEHLLDTVQRIVIKTKKNTPFTNGRPGRRWYASFLKRHPNLTERMSQNLTKRRANVTEKALRNWYKEIESYLTSKNLMNIEPKRIFNLDESGFLLSPKTKKVLVRKGEKAVYSVCDNEKECYTALIAGNAAGQLPPIMVVYNYERIPSLVAKHFPNEFVIGKSETGWMTSETFYMYIANSFYQWCVKSDIPFPIILYVDGHSSHLTMELSNFCCAHQIELIALFPNATHIMQPMDVSFFHPLKTSYREAVRNWRLENNGEALTKIHFASVLKTAIDSLDTKKNLQSSFKSCGLYPFSADSINYSKLIKNVETLNTPEESTTNQTPYDATHQEHLNFIESNIDPLILQEFEESYDTNIWTGSIEYKELFNLWLKCKRNIAAHPREQSIINQNKNPLIESQINPVGSISETNVVQIELYTDCITDKVMKSNSSNELYNNSIIIDEGSENDSEFINELQNITTISNNENFAKTTDDCILINQFTVDENNLIKSSEPIAISKQLLENNLITSPVILEDDLNTESLINENSNIQIPSDKTSIKDNTILSETSSNNDLLGNNNFKITVSLDEEKNSSSSEKDLHFQSDTHFNNELPIDLSIVNKSSTNNSNSIGEYYKLEYEENNNSIMYPRTVQQDCTIYGDENIAPNVNASFTKLQAHSDVNANNSSAHSVFQDCLFMPKKKIEDKKKRKCKERLPFVATGAEWRAWHTRNLDEKEKKEIKKIALQKQRVVDAKIKQESQENLKKIRFEKHKIIVQFKELELRLKENKAKEKLLVIQTKKGTPEEKRIAEQIKNLKQKIEEDLQLKEQLRQMKQNLIAEEKAIKGVQNDIKQPVDKNKH